VDVDSASAANSDGVTCIVLAAGAGRRFGARKQLARLGGRPLLEHAVAAAKAGGFERVAVVLGADATKVREGVDLRGTEVVLCQDWEEGMSAALRRGIAAVADTEAAMVLLGDQPLVGTAALERVLAARDPDRDAIRATYNGVPGHPVLIERSLFGAIAKLRGDAGARGLLEDASVTAIACDDVADPLDVDEPADLELAAERLRERGA
jgi:CTP:molybdopterin cytidylyltransferase MocA